MSLIGPDTRVENQELLAAILHQGTSPSPETAATLMEQLSRARLLAGVVPSADGENEEETKFVTAEHSGKIYLPLFTDWEAVRAYTRRDVRALVLAAYDAWDFALRQFDAVVINPGNDALPLERNVLEELLERRGMQ